MSDSLVIFGKTYSGVPSIIATDTNGTALQYIRPQGSKTINQNGSNIDVATYATVNVSVSGGGGEPSLQAKSVSYTPTTSAQSETVTADSGYDGLSAVSVAVAAIPSQYIVPTGSKTISANGSGIDVAQYATVNVSVPSDIPDTQSKTVTPTESQQTVEPDTGKLLSSVTVNAISSTYVGTGITRRSSTDLAASGATVTVPAGYYSTQASKAVASGSATTPAETITANPLIEVAADGTITATVESSKSITPTVSAGYISTGTAGYVSASGSATHHLSTAPIATITPTKSAQTAVAAGKYTTGAITVAAIPAAYQDVTGVTATASDVVSGKDIVNSSGTVVHGSLVIQHYYTGSSDPSASTGVNGDIYLKVVS